jgi:HD superfamily phosphohydrolase
MVFIVDCFHSLVRFSRVIDDEICFPAKEAFNLYELFHTRYSLFKQVYQHNVGKAIDFMICDALLEADPVMKISDAVFDPEEYIRLTDCVLKDIEVSRDPALSKAQAIIRRLRKRELYKLVDTILLPKQVEANMRKLTAEVLLSFAPAGCQLTVSDLIVDHMSINYALKDRNPVDNVHFFTSDHPHRKFKIPKEQVSNLIPDQFLERYIRIYLRDPEHPHKFEGAKAAVRFDICHFVVFAFSEC